MNMYRFIEVEKAGERSLNRAGAVLEVSRAADDEWRRQQPSRRAQEDQELTEKVRTIFTAPGRRTGRHGSTGRCARRDQVLAQAGGPADGRAATPGPAPSAPYTDGTPVRCRTSGRGVYCGCGWEDCLLRGPRLSEALAAFLFCLGVARC